MPSSKGSRQHAEAAASKPAASSRIRMPQVLRALKHRNFQLFFGGQLISLIGTWMQMVAQSWLVYRLTGSSLLLGTVGFAGQIPVFLLAPVGGAVADRYRRQRIVIATQSAAMLLALILAWLTLSGRVKVWEIIFLASLLGVVNAFDIPGRQAFLMDMVGREDLMNAIALNSSMFNGARVIGPAVAGLLVARFTEGWCFLANGISYIAVIAGLCMMRLTHPGALEVRGSALENIIEGFRYVQKTRPTRALLLLVGLVSLVGMPYSVLMPIFADQVLHGGPRALGLLMGAAGVGAVLGALVLAARSGLRGWGRWVALASSGFGASLIVFAMSRWFWLSMAVLVPVGFSMMLQMATSNTLIQAMVPDRLRGRVMSVYSMMFMGMAPLGALFGGAVAARIGAPWTVTLGGIACLIGSGAFALYLPSIRAETRELIIAQQAVGSEPPLPPTPPAQLTTSPPSLP